MSRRERQRAIHTAAQAPPPPRGDARTAWIVLGIAFALVALAYGNATGGTWVYDDTRQIVANRYIQQPQFFWKALGSDVWAFRGERGAAWSNYWRPMFIAWLTLCHRLFGLAPFGWHVTNLLLHALATALAFLALRNAGLPPAATALATWLFAAHPAHVESVTWISGSPDLLLACFLLGSYACHLAARARPGWGLRIASWALYAGAVLCKEVAIVFPVLVALTEFALPVPQPGRARRAGVAFAPLAAIAAVFFAARLAVIGRQQLVIPGAPDLGGVLVNAPRVLWFYVRHALAPFGLGPSYDLRAGTGAELLLAWLGAAALGALALWLWRRAPGYRLGLLWFALPLAPVFDLRNFLPEDFVHDRYLYLPLLGVAVLLGTALIDAARRLAPAAADGLAPALAVGLPLALFCVPLTRAYNDAWHDEVALWERGVATNPGSSFPHGQLGEVYRHAGRRADARRELERALELNPALTSAHVALGALSVQEQRWDDAQKHLELVLKTYPDNEVAVGQLALAFQAQGRLDAAAAVFEKGRRDIPYAWASFTVNLAVLQRMGGRPDLARATLESLGDRLARSTDPNVLRAHWFLGELHREAGRTGEAIAAYGRYLAATATQSDADTQALRATVQAQLAALRGAGR